MSAADTATRKKGQLIAPLQGEHLGIDDEATDRRPDLAGGELRHASPCDRHELFQASFRAPAPDVA